MNTIAKVIYLSIVRGVYHQINHVIPHPENGYGLVRLLSMGNSIRHKRVHTVVLETFPTPTGYILMSNENAPPTKVIISF